MSKNQTHILIVDDSADDILFVMGTLTDDYSVSVATHGEKALLKSSFFKRCQWLFGCERGSE